jgi:peptidyl-prolyl cis-trans isomerase SurA
LLSHSSRQHFISITHMTSSSTGSRTLLRASLAGRARRPLQLAILALGLLLGCGPAHRPMPKQRLPDPPRAAPGSAPVVPDLVEVRVLVVAYNGASGASAVVTRSKQEAQDRARMIARMARSGDRLAELVRKYSDRPGAAEDLGLFRLRPAQPGVFGEAVSKAALALASGQISDPVDAPEGYFVIERRPDPPAGPTRIGARHILISFKGADHALPGVTRSEAEARSLAEQVAREVREPGADWNAIAAKYTDEPGSKETGGDLGKFGRGQMVKSFETAAFALPVGQISDVVQSPFGFHVIQRYE